MSSKWSFVAIFSGNVTRVQFFYLKNSVILSPQLSRVPKWYTMLRNCSNDASRSIQSTKIYTQNFFTVGSCTSNKCDEEKIYFLLNGQCHVSHVRISTRIFIGQITESCYQTMLERNMMTFIFNLSTLSTGLKIETKKILFNFRIFFEKQTSLSSSVLGSRNCHSYRGSSSSRSSWAGEGGGVCMSWFPHEPRHAN